MKNFIRLIILACAISTPVHAQQTRYISDDLHTYMHSGPGTQFRIIGSVNAGAKVTQHEHSGDYIKITDSRGRNGWVSKDFITSRPGLKERMPMVEKELQETKAKLASAQQDANARHANLESALLQSNTQIEELETVNQTLSEQLSNTKAEMRDMRTKLDTQHNDLLMRWFMRGGMVAGGGLMFGLMLPHVMPRKKKKPNGWA
ncbi:TIGR04211 family SH3 domain-containing protein [Thaumasiovibrio sp. DFM-14]|uniref:TIGR04211 family SH3 domain-containing protein n=1 Tax=Thaumasiovibrio sp. DFM-14 TaxID=3384792 RepID=UPI0039A3738B